jgi:hypothetical protein
LGRAARDTGHKRLPTPPESKTGISIDAVYRVISEGEMLLYPPSPVTLSHSSHWLALLRLIQPLASDLGAPSLKLDQDGTFLYNCAR